MNKYNNTNIVNFEIVDMKELKITDVMVGDWVDVRNNASPNTPHLERITPSHFLRDEHWYGVELVPEILEKNGFEELMSEGWESAAKFGRTPEPTGVWQYGFGQFDSVAYVPEQSFLRIKFMEGCQTDIANIKYVHELQHTLRLLKINKDIEL